MIKLALASLRHRLPAFVATFIAIGVAIAVLFACAGLFESGIRLNASPQRLSAAPIVVTSNQVYHPPNGSGSADLVARVAGVDGHTVPDMSFPLSSMDTEVTTP